MNFEADSTAGASPTPVDLALDVLATGFDHLLKLVDDGDFDAFDDAGLIGFLHGFETFRNRLPLLDHRAITDVMARDLPAKLTHSSTPRMLASMLRLSPGEATRRVRAAEAVGERRPMLGEALEPVRPHLAAAQRSR